MVHGKARNAVSGVSTLAIIASLAGLSPCAAQSSAQSATEADPNEQREIVVLGQRRSDYSALASSTGLKIDAPLIETPLSVSVVPDTLLDDRQVIDLDRAGDTVAGIQSQDNYSITPAYVIRGFQTSGAATTINGYRLFGFSTILDPIALDRVEFLKGPSSVLYGSSSAVGGLVNFATKAPVDESFAEASLVGGQSDILRATLDANLASSGGDSGARLTAAIGREGFLTAFTPLKYKFVNFSATKRLGADVKLLAEGFYADQVSPGSDNSGYFPDARFLDLRGFKPGAPFARLTNSSYGGRLELDWQFASEGSARVGAFYNASEIKRRNAVQPNFGEPFSEDGRFYNQRVSRGYDNSKDLSVLAETKYEVEIGGTKHKLLGGFNFKYYKFGPYGFFSSDLPPLDLENPVYPSVPPPDDSFTLNYTPEGYSGRSIGLYVQDFIEIGDKIRVLAGVRYDIEKSKYFNIEGVIYNEQTDKAWSPRLGAVFLATPDLSMFVNWSKSFSPNYFFRNGNGEAFKPERGIQVEGGVKAELFDDRLTVTASLYDLRRRNIIVADPIDPDLSRQSGEQRSRGLEIEATGRPLRNLQFSAFYSYIDAEVTKDTDPAYVGDRLPLAPRHSASIWTRYNIPIDSMYTAAVGGGFFYGSKRQAELPNTNLVLRGYEQVDLFAQIERKDGFTAQINVANLFDQKRFDSTGFYIVPRRGRTVTGSITVRF